jgi:hypothetical protein
VAVTAEVHIGLPSYVARIGEDVHAILFEHWSHQAGLKLPHGGVRVFFFHGYSERKQVGGKRRGCGVVVRKRMESAKQNSLVCECV